MSDDPGHRYKFGAPSGGWPSFDAAGKKVTEEPKRLPTFAEIDAAKARRKRCPDSLPRRG